MASRNTITGDLQQTKAPSKEFLDDLKEKGLTKSIEDRRKSRGKFKWCSEEKAFIPAQEYYAKNPPKQQGRAPMTIIKNFENFQSPVSGNIIQNEKQQQYDLESNDCRLYEGYDQEAKEANRYLEAQDKALEQSISNTVDETAYQIEHNYSRPQVEEKISWTFGED